MIYDKEKYEGLIELSPLFSLDKECQRSAFKRESLKMVEYLYCYLLAISISKYEPYGCEIVEVATRCINGFDRTGSFLHYFNAAWKKEFSHICGGQIIENKLQGLRITEREERSIKKYLSLVSKCSRYNSEEELFLKVAELMEIPVKAVEQIASISGIRVHGAVSVNSEGEELSILEQIPDKFLIESCIDEHTSIENVLKNIQAVFDTLQNRQKPIVSEIITLKMAEPLLEAQIPYENYPFIAQEIINIVSSNGKLPFQRDMAIKYSRSEASISRTIKEFLSKLNEQFRGDE